MNKKILIFGGSGLVGSRFIELCQADFDIESPDLYQVDLLKSADIKTEIERVRPDLVINFAAFTDVDGAEKEKDNKNGLTYLLNAKAPKELAEICHKKSCYLVHISTDYVFDGQAQSAYKEADLPNPANWYGRTKYFGEQFVLESGVSGVVVRIERPYRATYKEKSDFARFFLERLKQGQIIEAVEDQRITPILADDVVMALKAIIGKQVRGIYHVVSADSTSPLEFAQSLAKEFGFSQSLVKAVQFAQFNQDKKVFRAQNSVLDTTKFKETFGSGILHTNKEGIELLHKQIVLLGNK